MKKTPKLHAIHAVILAVVFVVISGNSFAVNESAEKQQTITTYQKNRQDFIEKKRVNSEAFTDRQQRLNQEIKDIQQFIANEKNQIQKLNETIREYESYKNIFFTIQGYVSSILFPEVAPLIATASLFNPSLYSGFQLSNLLYIFLSLTLINIVIYIYRRHKERFHKFKVILIIFAAVLLVSIYSPLFAASLDKQQEIVDQLEIAEKVLSLSEYERFIAILESKQAKVVHLPQLSSGNALLSIARKVEIDTPEYWHTLAGLYFHEAKFGRTIEAIKHVTEESALSDKDEHRRILVNSIKFLIERNETGLASQAIERLDEKILSATQLLDLASLLYESSMRASAEKVLGYAVKKASSVTELVELSEFLIRANNVEKATEALNKAMKRAQDVKDFLRITTVAINNGKDNVIAEISKRVHEVLIFTDLIKLVDLFIANGRKEEAIIVLSEMIRSVNFSSPDRIESLTYLLEASLDRGLLAQTASVAEKLYFFLGREQAFVTRIEKGSSLPSTTNLPDSDRIMLPQFYGLVSEERGFMDEAEMAYMQAVSESLKRLLDSYGYKIPESLNDFHLLGRLWAEGNQVDLIHRLDRVFLIIERLFLERQSQLDDIKLQGSKEQIQTLKDTHTQLLDSVAEQQAVLNQAKKEMTLQAISMAATLLLVILALVGCGIIAHRHSRKLSAFKTFGFFWKFFEARGWLGVMSLAGMVTGLFSVIISQLFLIFQRKEQNTNGLLTGSLAKTASVVEQGNSEKQSSGSWG